VRHIDLSGVQAIVTGASSGLGVETASSLARAGAHVTLAVRNLDHGRRVSDEIAANDGPHVAVSQLDLAHRDSIRRFVADWRGPLHVLVNNAGVCANPLEYTADGWELQFATNHLGHFALAVGLHDALATGAKDRGEARIVAVSSSSHALATVNFDDPNFQRDPYDPWVAYARSKTANVLFSVEASRRWGDHGVFANAVNPGAIRTRLQRYFPPEALAAMDQMENAGVLEIKTPQQGAATSIVAAVSPKFAGMGGRYLDDCREAETMPNDVDGSTEFHRVREWALDPIAARRLWDDSLALVG
jgi:NAD(P)-dependent dehydrogenase (short-subunit alcohol dehydrogenase family)